MKTKVKKSNYMVFDYSGGYYGIVERKTLKCVFGGDSANEDDYDFHFIRIVYESWNGTLTDELIQREDWVERNSD